MQSPSPLRFQVFFCYFYVARDRIVRMHFNNSGSRYLSRNVTCEVVDEVALYWPPWLQLHHGIDVVIAAK